MTPLAISQFLADSRSAMPVPPRVASAGAAPPPNAGAAKAPPAAPPAPGVRGIRSGGIFHSLVTSMSVVHAQRHDGDGIRLDLELEVGETGDVTQRFDQRNIGQRNGDAGVRRDCPWPSERPAAGMAGIAGAGSKPGMPGTPAGIGFGQGAAAAAATALRA